MGASLWATTGRTDLVQRLQPLFAGAPAICACEGNTDLESTVLNPTVQFLLRGKRSTECLGVVRINKQN